MEVYQKWRQRPTDNLATLYLRKSAIPFNEQSPLRQISLDNAFTGSSSTKLTGLLGLQSASLGNHAVAFIQTVFPSVINS